MGLMNKIKNNLLFRGLVNVEVVIMVVTSILAAGVVFVGVVLRYVLKSNFFGQEEILCIIAMWLYWMGGVYGTYENSHIKGDLLSSLFRSPKAKKAIELVILIVSFVTILIFIIWGWEYMSFNLAFRAVSTGLKLPLWWSQIPLLIGFILMELYTVYHFFRVLLDKNFGIPQETASESGEETPGGEEA